MRSGSILNLDGSSQTVIKYEMKIYIWETDKDFNPVEGKEWVFNSKSLRDVMSHMAYTLGGKISLNKKSVTLPDGNRIFGTILENDN